MLGVVIKFNEMLWYQRKKVPFETIFAGFTSHTWHARSHDKLFKVVDSGRGATPPFSRLDTLGKFRKTKTSKTQLRASKTIQPVFEQRSSRGILPNWMQQSAGLKYGTKFGDAKAWSILKCRWSSPRPTNTLKIHPYPTGPTIIWDSSLHALQMLFLCFQVLLFQPDPESDKKTLEYEASWKGKLQGLSLFEYFEQSLLNVHIATWIFHFLNLLNLLSSLGILERSPLYQTGLPILFSTAQINWFLMLSWGRT